MLSSVTLKCQVTKNVMNSGSQLSNVTTQVSRIVFVDVFVLVFFQSCHKLSKLAKIVNSVKKIQQLSQIAKIVINCHVLYKLSKLHPRQLKQFN